jgi:hypothetical protein
MRSVRWTRTGPAQRAAPHPFARTLNAYVRQVTQDDSRCVLSVKQVPSRLSGFLRFTFGIHAECTVVPDGSHSLLPQVRIEGSGH